MNDKTVSPLVALVLAAMSAFAGWYIKLPEADVQPAVNVTPGERGHVFPPRPSILPSREAAGEMTINGQVALTWVRVSDQTIIYMAKKDNPERVIHIVATPTQISVVNEGRRVGDVGAAP